MKEQSQNLPLNQRFTLTLKEASQYFHIGEKKLRRMAAEDPGSGFLLHNGRKVLIIREEFEQFLRQTSCI
ncbi:excisionase [Acidaminococcus fermentans]|uniref:excisionase n=1 Tax=Acidaminococcus fermentans TaxID=905 RepID=UPI002E77D1CC|nr:excisionase [Acidaminococcus fermentans]MEE1597994.1 excisionase [Acidaminococcus fermentans]MEE4122256.1 excisionase [Acidaminococcus fermentans]